MFCLEVHIGDGGGKFSVAMTFCCQATGSVHKYMTSERMSAGTLYHDMINGSM